MPEFYGEELDRQKMWERIANGIIVSVAKSNKAWDKFINDMLIYIKADMVRVSSNVDFNEFMMLLAEKPISYHVAWLRYFETRHMILIPFARLAWQGRISDKKETVLNRKKDKVESIHANISSNSSSIDTPSDNGGLF